MKEKSGTKCYALFRELGLDYGATFQGIDTLYYSTEEALSKLNLSKEEGYVLPPGLLDSALQTCLGFGFANQEKALALPFSVKEVNLYRAVNEACWTYARRSSGALSSDQVMKYDIDLLSETGAVLLSFREFVMLPVDGFQGKEQETLQLRYYAPQWEEREITAHQDTSSSDLVIVLAGGSASLAKSLTDRLACEVIALAAPTETDYYLRLQALVQNCLARKASTHLTVFYRAKEAVKYGFISGLLKTAQLEHPGFRGKVIAIERLSLQALDNLAEIFVSEQEDRSLEVRYLGEKREVKQVSPMEVTSISNLLIKSGGVYLITGGAGGLGRLFAEYISKTKDTKLILTGRQEQSPLSKAQLASLHATYHSCDVTIQQAVATLISSVLGIYGRLDGIIHSAGLIKNSFLLKKTSEEAEAVLLPKIKGVRHLDAATKTHDLDFMVYCSSVAGVMGNVGQADYASANAFMDGFAHHRNALVNKGQRQGKTLSINWPLWREGGMQVDAASEHYLDRTWGMQGLPTQEGMKAFEALLRHSSVQGMVVYGLPSKMNKKLLRPVEKHGMAAKAPGFDVKALQSESEKVMLQFASELLKLDVAHLSVDEELGDYGVDSILMTRFAHALNEYYGIDLQPTVFFNYPTIGELSAYLAADYAEALAKQHAIADQPALSKPILTNQRFNGITRRKRRVGITGSALTTTPLSSNIHEPIAIIGMSGRFPGSPNLDVFWEQIRENKDLITEVPKDRWDWEAYYGDPQTDKGKTKAKWGGFIEGIDQFDPLHFSISPREAELMDPQQRLALESVWHALEDAGIAPRSLKGTDTGIFVGVSSHDYSMLVHQQCGDAVQAQSSTGSAHSVLVNRISYLLDLHGPSEPIDTACSSSLIAIHRAVEHLRHGYGKLAIAGGVNALLSPEVTLSFSQAGMLSEDGSCKTFDQRANGYVRGEGVGMVVLKSLSQAKADGDRIHALIRSTSENHGGKANTLTSPNPKAQKDLLLKAYRQAGIEPRRVSYIEAHGTGTALGDPVEVEGLKGAFKALYQERDLEEPATPHIRLGSVKANIGHLESAAGIAGVLKVVQAMKHELLPGNPHLERPNEYLQLEGTPFALQKETTSWETSVDEPRLAGVSSFGFGGANAHVVMEEYREALRMKHGEFRMEGPFIVPLSAKNEARLEEMVQNLSRYLEDPTKTEHLNLSDLAYTLQIGRESMEVRLALLVNDLEEFKTQLGSYQKGDRKALLIGNVKKDQSDFLLEGEAGRGYIEIAMRNKESKSLAQLWVKGVEIDWNLLYEEGFKPNKISLPTYPFTRERYWIPEGKAPAVPVGNTSKLHPLLHGNESDFSIKPHESVHSEGKYGKGDEGVSYSSNDSILQNIQQIKELIHSEKINREKAEILIKELLKKQKLQ